MKETVSEAFDYVYRDRLGRVDWPMVGISAVVGATLLIAAAGKVFREESKDVNPTPTPPPGLGKGLSNGGTEVILFKQSELPI